MILLLAVGRRNKHLYYRIDINIDMSEIQTYENKELNQKITVESIPEFHIYNVKLFKNGQLISQKQLSSVIFRIIRDNGFIRID